MADSDMHALPEKAIPPETLEMHLIKGMNYRTIHVDGTICSITQHKNIAITLFNERAAIPQYVLHKTSTDGTPEGPVEVRGKTGIVRELEATLMVSPSALLDLIAQLDFHRKVLINANIISKHEVGKPVTAMKPRRQK